MGQAPLPVGASSVSKEIALHIGSGGGGQMRAGVTFVIPEPNVTGPVGTAAGTPVLSLSSTSITPPSPAVGDTLPGAHNSGGTGTTGTWAIALSSLQSPFGSSSIPDEPLPLPENVQLNPAMTQVTHVPCINSLQLIPRTLKKNINEAQARMKMNKDHEGVLKKMRERMTAEMKGMFGGAMWWEKGSPGVDVNSWKRGCEGVEVRYPLRREDEKEKEGRDKRKRRREGLKLPRKIEPVEADRPEQLVPIRLEFDVGRHKMRDTFVWNLNDPVVTPEVFAQSIVDDYTLAPSYHSIIVKSIQEQLTDYRAHSLSYERDSGELVVETPVLRGTLSNSHAQWWEAWRRGMKATRSRTTATGAAMSRKKQKLDATEKVKGEEKTVVVVDVPMKNGEEFGGPIEIDEIKFSKELMHEEFRILIKLDIIVGTTKLEDQFEWDIENGAVTPEEFSDIYAQDLGLRGEFKSALSLFLLDIHKCHISRTAIAHSIREQVQMYRKSLFLVGHPSDDTPIQNEKLRQAFLPSLAAVARPMDQVPAYTPVLNTVSASDIEQSEKKLEKEVNKRKRNQRGRSGIVVPGREPVRTHRTPANGFPEIDPATLTLTAVANASGSRRAAAAAASLMIANMIASENDATDITITTPTPQATKGKRSKDLFRALTVLPPALVSLENDPPPPSLEPKMKIRPKDSTKKLEREAMEKVFADGQYPNWIDGIWHCSNCGCPKSMTISRRGGPLGEKSLCGLCGKFWHKHHRPRPVEYNPDPEFHTRQSSDSKTPAQYKAAFLRAHGIKTHPPPGQAQQVRGATAGPLQSPTMVQLSSTSEGGLPPAQQHQRQGQFGIPEGTSPHMEGVAVGGRGMIPHNPTNLDAQGSTPQQQQQQPGRQSGIGGFPSHTTTPPSLIHQSPTLPVRQVNGDIINLEILQIPNATLEVLKSELGLSGLEITQLKSMDKQRILAAWKARRPSGPKSGEAGRQQILQKQQLQHMRQLQMQQDLQNHNKRNSNSRGDEDFGQRFNRPYDPDPHFERDFGQWFHQLDDLFKPDRDLDFERDFGQWG